MASFNKVILYGNLTRDPEMRVTPGGVSITGMGLATNRVYTDKNDQKKEEVTFVDITAFGRQAETIAKYCSRGDALLIEGRLKLEQWLDQQGAKKSKLVVIMESFQFGAKARGASAPDASPPPAQSGTASANQLDEEDDVPF